MGQIIGSAAKPKRCNLSKLSQLGTPAAGEYILVSSDNSMNAAGQGNFDCYIMGNGTTAATALELKSINKERTYNLFDSSLLKSAPNITYSDGVFSGQIKNFGANGFEIPVKTEAGKTYIFCYKARIATQSVATGTGLAPKFRYAGSSSYSVSTYADGRSSVLNSATEWQQYGAVTNGSEVVAIRLDYSSGGNNVIEIKDMMLIEGYSVKDYIPYFSYNDEVGRNDIQKLLPIQELSYLTKGLSDFSLTSGPYIAFSTGASVASGSYNRYTFNNEEFGGTKIKVIVADNGTSVASIAFYSGTSVSEETYMSEYAVCSSNNPLREITVDIPTEAKLIAVTNRNTVLATPTIVLYKPLKNFILDNSVLQTTPEQMAVSLELYKNMVDINDLFVEGYRIKKATGAVEENSSYVATDFVFVPKGSRISYKLYTSNGNLAVIAVYNLNKIMIETYGYVTQGEYNEGVYIATEDCYMRFSGDKTKIYVANFENISGTIPERLNALEQNSSEGSGLNTVDVELYKNMVNINDLFEVGHRIVKATGELSEDQDYVATDFVFVPKGSVISYKLFTANENLAVIAVYDLNKTMTATYGYVTQGDYNEGDYTATEDCYMRFSGYKRRTYTANFKNIPGTIPERLSALEQFKNGNLPDYWISYLNEKQPTINAAISVVGNHGDTLLFFSDFHIARNACNSPAVIKELCRRYQLDKVVFGGDIINSDTSVDAAMGEEEDFYEMMEGLPLYSVYGNHDGNPYGGSGNVLSVDNWYPLMFKKLEGKPNVSMTKLGYYYFDNPVQKIKYIVLNTGDNGIGYTSAADIAQLDWLCSVLNSVENGWHVVLFSHVFYEIYTDSSTQEKYIAKQCGALITAITDAYQNKASGTYGSETPYSFDFTSAHGKMACILVGHVHYDYSEQSSAGYPIIAIIQDGYLYPSSMADNPTRTAGTYTEQAMDVVCIDTTGKTINTVRIGVGNNRSFTFT